MKAQLNPSVFHGEVEYRLVVHRPERGVALIIVLAMLVLLSGLIVSFMSSVGNERAASVVNSGTATTRQLADSTVNLVIAQIRDGTTQSGNNATWASQPGAIRTFTGQLGSKMNLNRGQGYAYTYTAGGSDWVYKLYSADKMKVTSSQYANDLSSGSTNNEVGVIENWDRTKPKAGFADLNEPVLAVRPDLSTANQTIVEPRYPIIDPRARFDYTETPLSAAFGIVEGLDCKSGGNLADNQLKTPGFAKTGTPVPKPVPYLPMPVKWLYVLRDGSMAAADTTTGKIQGASVENPIVGRTAFWTDDESCKLNINTASEGVFWDTPSVSTSTEAGVVNTTTKKPEKAPGFSMSSSQPAQGEYQRYPGHPATTCLSPALGWLWDLTPTTNTRPTFDAPGSGLVGTDPYRKFKEAIYAMAPFIPVGKGTSAGMGTGGTGTGLSDAGTKFPGGEALPGGTDNPDRTQTGTEEKPIQFPPALATKALYANTDEYLFKRDNLQGQTPIKATKRLLNSFTNTNLGVYSNDPKTDFQKKLPLALEKLRFVLTANSRAPELNLFGRPRVTIWPIHSDTKLRTPSDDLFAFTSTVGGTVTASTSKAYYFVRTDAKTDYADADIPRNKGLVTYLQSVTGDNNLAIPGFGGTFAKKYAYTDPYGAKERDQILTEIFDYIRSVNLVDTGFSRNATDFQPYTPFYGRKAGADPYQRNIRPYNWSGQVTPAVIAQTKTKGLGRFPMIAEVGLLFQRTKAEVKTPTQVDGEMQAVLFFEITIPMPGFPALRETYWTKVTQVDDSEQPVSVAAQATVQVPFGSGPKVPLSLCAKSEGMINIPNIPSHEVLDGRAFLPTLGCGTAFLYYSEQDKAASSTPPPAHALTDFKVNLKTFRNDDLNSITYKRKSTILTYPYVSNKIVANPGQEFLLSKIRFRIEIYAGECPGPGQVPTNESPDKLDSKSTLSQIVYVTFPEVKLKAPTATAVDTLAGRFGTMTGGNTVNGDQNWIKTTDTVRTMELVGGSPSGLKVGSTSVPQMTTGTTLSGNLGGDFRIAMVRKLIPDYFFQPRGGDAAYKGAATVVHGLQYGHGDKMSLFSPTEGVIVAGGLNRDNKVTMIPAGIQGVMRKDNKPGDWDRGLSKHMDGAFANRPDEGNVQFAYDSAGNAQALPYFLGRSIEETGQTFFSPNRLMSSPVMFGSLPSGALEGKPWQTLLFRPDRENISAPGHPGAANLPPDHLLLDLFHMPIVEPYAISEPFSTAGKVNLNFVIAPFGYAKGDSGKNFTTLGNPVLNNDRSYLRRDTALRGVLKSVKFMAVPTGVDKAAHRENPSEISEYFRFDIDPNLTLEEFENRFKDPKRGLFRSASEICDIDLYPYPINVPVTNAGLAQPTSWSAFWASKAQTGDNMRERPYSMIYPRVTTKSNVFTVHMRCQALKKAPSTAADEFVEDRDQVRGEYRGSATIERYIDPNDAKLKDYRELDESLDQYYRFRVVGTKQFAPK